MSLQLPHDSYEIVKDEIIHHERILALLREAPRSVQQVATAIDAPTPDVMRWMMAMRRYEWLEETGQTGEDGGSLYAVRQQGEQMS